MTAAAAAAVVLRVLLRVLVLRVLVLRVPAQMAAQLFLLLLMVPSSRVAEKTAWRSFEELLAAEFGLVVSTHGA